MRIGGLQPFSLSDFPGKTSAILFTIGCNFRCPFCHNKKLFDEQHPIISEGKIFAFLRSRKKQLDGVVITGGEPTIHNNLIAFIKKISKLGYAIKLDTNGSNPEILQTLIKNNLLSFVAMDIKAPFEKYNKLSGINVLLESIKKSINIISSANIPHEFRTTFATQWLNQQDIEKIKNIIPKASYHKTQECINN